MKKVEGGVEIGGMQIRDSFLKPNGFMRFFNKNRGHANEIENERVFNSQGISQEELVYGSAYSKDKENPYGGISTINIQFDQYFQTKAAKIAKYREMSYYPEIANALDMITDEAVVPDDNGKLVTLSLRKEVPEHIEEELRKIWDYLVTDVFSFNETSWEMFYRWLVEGELYLELILNENGNNIIGIKILPPFTMYPIYRENQIIAFIQSVNQYLINNPNATIGTNISPADEDIMFDRDQIVYVNSGKVGASNYDIRGFLDYSVRTYNQLKNLEDATVVNKIIRAPMRRVFNVAVGRMTKTRGEEYVKGMMNRHRKRVKYDQETGAMDSSENFLAMIEDFWFPKVVGEEGTTVTNLEGSATFSEMDDVNYFLKKLYKTLRLPSSRWSNIDTPAVYSGGRNNEITREELQFSNFVGRLQNRFKYVLLDAFITLLRLRGFDDRYVDYALYDAQFNQGNSHKQYRELEILSERLNVLTAADPFIYKREENENGYFDPEYVLKNFFLMKESDYKENLYYLNKTKNNVTESQKAEGNDEVGNEPGMEDVGGMGVVPGGAPEGGEKVPPAEEGATPEEMGGTEETGGVESISFQIKKVKPTSVLVEFVEMDKEIRRKASEKFRLLRENK